MQMRATGVLVRFACDACICDAREREAGMNDRCADNRVLDMCVLNARF